MLPIQPPDETPLPAASLANYVGQLEYQLPLAKQKLQAATTDAHDAVQEAIDQSFADVTTAKNNLNLSIKGAIGGATQQLDKRMGAINSAVKKAAQQTSATVEKAVDGLSAQGVPVATGTQERTIALSDTALGAVNAIASGLGLSAATTPTPAAATIYKTGVLYDGTGYYQTCKPYLADSPWIGEGFGLYDSNYNLIGTWAGVSGMPGYYFVADIAAGCGNPTVPNVCPPLPFKLGDPCQLFGSNWDGNIIRNSARPGQYLCSTNGATGEPYQCAVVDNGVTVNPGATGWPTTPLPPSPPASPPIDTAPGSPPPPPDTASPLAPPPPPPDVSSPLPFPAPPVAPPPPVAAGPDGFCPPQPAQCPAPVINVTVACPPGGSVSTVTSTGDTTTTTITGSPPTAPPVASPTAPPTVPVVPATPPDLTPAPPAPPVVPVEHLPQDQTSVDWSNPSVCSQVQNLCDQLTQHKPPAKSGTSNAAADRSDKSWWDTAVDTTVALGTGNVSKLADILWEGDPPTSYAATAVAQTWTWLASFAGESIAHLLPAGVHNPGACAFYSARLGMANFASKWAGIPLDYYFTADKYAAQFCDPQFLPSQAEVTGAWLRSQMTDAEWECYTKANGNLVEQAKKVRDAATVVPNVGELIQLWYRGSIKNRVDLESRLRAIGVTNPNHSQEWIDLAKWLPGPSDLIRYMVRDAADDSVATKYQYDFEFSDKFKGKIQDFAEQQGIDPDVFKFEWRSHWQIPSNTALYEMLHRLRPDRAEVRLWELRQREQEALGQPLEESTRPPVVTVDDIRTALEVNDNAPGWITALLAISYRPITNTDGRRMFQVGFIDKPALIEQFQDTGYALADANKLTDYEDLLKTQTIAARSGVLSLREIVGYYRDGLVSRDDADKLLVDQMPDIVLRGKLLDGVDTQVRLKLVKLQIAVVRKQFLYGIIDFPGAVAGCVLAGVPALKATTIVNGWDWERQNRLKEPRLAQLCRWYVAGYMNDDEYIRRIRNLGYSETDAYRIAGICWSDEVVKRNKQAAKAAAARMKEIEKQVKEQQAGAAQQLQEVKAEIALLQAEAGLLRATLPGQRPSHNGTPAGHTNP